VASGFETGLIMKEASRLERPAEKSRVKVDPWDALMPQTATVSTTESDLLVLRVQERDSDRRGNRRGAHRAEMS